MAVWSNYFSALNCAACKYLLVSVHMHQAASKKWFHLKILCQKKKKVAHFQ